MASVVALPASMLPIVHNQSKLLVEEQIKHQHKAAAVSGDARLVID